MAPDRLLVLLALAGAASCAAAQTLYRCGSTFSQTPCDKTAEPIKVYPDRRADPPPGLRGAELCKRLVPAAVPLKDPYSAVVEVERKGRSEVIEFKGQPLAARRFDVFINAKNSYGAYTGEKLYRCYLSEDEARLLRVVSPGD